MVLGTWLLLLYNASCASLSGKAQHPCSSPPALIIRSGFLRLSFVPGDEYHTKGGKDFAEITLNSRCWLQPFLNMSATDALKSRFAGITTCNVEDSPLKEMMQSYFRLLQFSCNKFCPRYFLSKSLSTNHTNIQRHLQDDWQLNKSI